MSERRRVVRAGSRGRMKEAATARWVRVTLPCVWALMLAASPGFAQVLTIDTSGRPTTSVQAASVDRRFAQVQPTHVELPKTPLTPKSRLALIRYLEVEPGFAMRPFPGGHKGLTLTANGKLDPAGEGYLNLVTQYGVSARPGDKVVITDIKVDKSRIVLDFNGGPDLKHRFLRHIEIGDAEYSQPIIQDDGTVPTGSRITLVFPNHVPDLTGDQVEALLAPLISFKVKSPIEAFTDTLPPMLKDAILNHHVLVGMTTDMVLFAKGQPDRKSREIEGQMPFVEWIYGKPPQDIEFVRINGNRVIRVEIAAVGRTPVIFTRDVVEGMMRTDGTPLGPPETTGVRTVELGDVHPDTDKQAPTAPPTLAGPGEKLPADDGKDSRVGVMKPVQFPKQAPDDAPVAHQPNAQSPQAPASAPADSQTPATGAGKSGAAPASSNPPAGSGPAKSGSDASGAPPQQ
ncbi:MAG: hypothetical protein WCA37_08465 [Terracidiphilus sp.]